MGKITRAILSVSDKTGVVDLARGLQAAGVEILSTGGTCRLLADHGIAVTEVSTHTGFPEMLDGRIKTLHPRIHGGILGRRDDPSHLQQMAAHGLLPIDLVAVNLYPFEATIAKPNVPLHEAIEQIDIGGPAMLRSAAKNYRDVIVVCDPADYAGVLADIQADGPSEDRRYDLARKVFAYTAGYDQAICAYLATRATPDAAKFPDPLTLRLEKVQTLRYGENPHQKAALYKEVTGGGLAAATQLWGKEMSYNNFLDTHAALALAQEFSEPACVIVKHNNPCGVAVAARLDAAYQRAKACDPVSAFGGVVAFNRPIDLAAAQACSGTFTEVVIAPGILPDALALFQKKKDLRVLSVGDDAPGLRGALEVRRISGGLLVQEVDRGRIADPTALKVASQRPPTPEEVSALLFAWTVCKHVKSNAIVFARGGQTVGIGAGQMSRVDSVRLAAIKARERQDQTVPTAGCAMASDAFFPFRDGIDEAARSGITAVIQPGGSIRDVEVIAAADAHGMAMLFTGMRHFRH